MSNFSIDDTRRVFYESDVLAWSIIPTVPLSRDVTSEETRDDFGRVPLVQHAYSHPI